MTPDELAQVAYIIRQHQTIATGLGEWACKCSPSEWRPTAHRSQHVTDALAPVIDQMLDERIDEIRTRVQEAMETGSSWRIADRVSRALEMP